MHLSIVSWNVNAVKSKLANPRVQHFLCTHDVICLFELKTPLEINLPGYKTFRNHNTTNNHRGGCAILIKNYLQDNLQSIKSITSDTMLLKLNSTPSLTIAACYLPPTDSPYYSVDGIASLQATIKENPDEYFVALGDFNARGGRYNLCPRLTMISIPFYLCTKFHAC